MAEKGKNRINVTVVVSGQNVSISVNTHAKVKELVHEALRESGNVGQEIDNWTLTSEAGPIDFDLNIVDAGIEDGMKLYLSPKAGEGGN